MGRLGGNDMSDRGAGQAFVTETFDLEDNGRMSGLFAAHWESEDDSSGRWIEGPEDVPLEVALAWARGRSDAILVQVGGGQAFYSAGTTDLTCDGGDEDDPVPVLLWPEDGLEVAARPVETPLDGREQIVLWRVHVGRLKPHVWKPVATALLASPLVVRIEEPTDPNETADVIVRGDGVNAVFGPLWQLISDGLADLGVSSDQARFEFHMGSPDLRVVD
jgi:hypothetical protein